MSSTQVAKIRKYHCTSHLSNNNTDIITNDAATNIDARSNKGTRPPLSRRSSFFFMSRLAVARRYWHVCVASSDSFWVMMQLEFACACRLTYKKVTQLHTSGVLAIHNLSSVVLLLARAIKSIQ
jgi:hypothetical protein